MKKLSEAGEWDRKWFSIFEHYHNDTRHAYYVHSQLRKNHRCILEIGAGSFRDVVTLNGLGYDCHGTDFSESAVALAKQKFPQLAEKFHCMDARNLDFADNRFDATYHNGFWGLFDEPGILALAREQFRVTRSLMMATVHNAHNSGFEDYFIRSRDQDPIFAIDFFTVDRISSILSGFSEGVRVIPVGHQKKYHEDWIIKNVTTNKYVLRGYLKWCGMRHLHTSERLLGLVGTGK